MTEVSVMRVEIADVDQLFFSGICNKLVAPAAHGEVCILPRHTPMLAALRPGEIRLQTQTGEDQSFYVSGGYLEVKSGDVTVLADQMLRSAEIDRTAAQKAKEDAQKTLRESHLFSLRDEAKIDLMKALAQLQVLEHAEMHRLKKLK